MANAGIHLKSKFSEMAIYRRAMMELAVCAMLVFNTPLAMAATLSTPALGTVSAALHEQPLEKTIQSAPGVTKQSPAVPTSSGLGKTRAGVAPIPYHQAPAESPAEAILGNQRAKAIHQALIGQWVTTIGNESLVLTFGRPNLFKFGEVGGRFTVGNNATLVLSTDRAQKTYLVELEGAQLTLTSEAASALRTPIKFLRKPAPLAWVYKWFDVRPRQVANKFWHVMTVLIFVVIAQLILAGIRRLSYLAVFSNTGLFGKFYYQHENRARTIHLLVLNIIKYVVYLTALGMILTELGVNIGAYLVSLSVVGLAIGFGSQDLVRDMVTGFFVVFENQYDVGDMVDIADQTGVVTEIGLRMTRLRNYMGQTMVIPNRTIDVVGKYFKGAQSVNVDVQLERTDDVALEHGRSTILAVAEQIRDEFSGVVIAQPTIEIDEPRGDNGFVRLRLPIWPGQSWLVDQRLLPQLREALAAAELKIVGDRIVVFYHATEQIKP